MALISKKHKIIYIQVPGTGCSVVSILLRKHYGAQNLGVKHNDIAELLDRGLISEEDLSSYTVVANIRNPYDCLVTYYTRYTGGWLDRYFAFRSRELQRRSNSMSDVEIKIAEDQLDREKALKYRRQKIMRVVGFNFWLFYSQLQLLLRSLSRRDVSYRQALLERLFPMLGGVNLVMRQEDLEAAFMALQKDYLQSKSPLALPVKNVTPNKRFYGSYYNRFSRWWFSMVIRKELKVFGYSFGVSPDDGRRLLKL